jgi:hypothetical protein
VRLPWGDNLIDYNMVGVAINFNAMANGTAFPQLNPNWWVDNDPNTSNVWGVWNFHN